MPALLTLLLTGALLAGHVAVLETLGTSGRGPTLSNLIQLALGVVCLLGTLGAARGARGFEKRFLWLMAGRYLLWSIAQTLGIFDTGRDVPFESSLANLLFHLEDVPLALALFLAPDAGSYGKSLGRPRALDLAQTALFLGAIMLYSFLSPEGPGSGVGRLASTDALVAGAFYLRAMTTSSPLAAALFGRWTPAILLSAVNDAFAGHLTVIPQTGELFDLVWSGESIVWIVTAATWKGMNADLKAVQQTIDASVRRLPIVVACFSIAVALALLARRPVLGGALAAAAIACAAPRLRDRPGDAT